MEEWHRLLKLIGSEHREILRQTLPTISFRLLLEAKCKDCDKQLTQLDLSRDAEDFKAKYKSVKLQQDQAETLLSFVNSLTED